MTITVIKIIHGRIYITNPPYKTDSQGGIFMELNGVNSYQTKETAAYSSKTASAVSKTTTANSTTTTAAAYSEVSATYEGSAEVYGTSSLTDRSAIIAQMKADSDARFNQLQTLVTQMFQKQGYTIGTADDMWKILASGNFTADADTIAQAKQDISEDGYWGVKQTSERIFSFAVALSGGDDKKMQELVKAVEKGFSEATKTWGKELPEISQNTFSAVMDKFDNWFKENASTATTAALLNS